MPICFRCPSCDRLLSTATRKAGSSLVCPGCAGPVVAPLLSRPIFSPSGSRRPLGRVFLVSAALLLALLLSASAEVIEPSENHVTLAGQTDSEAASVPEAVVSGQSRASERREPPVREERSHLPVDAARAPVAAPVGGIDSSVIRQDSPLIVFVPVFIGEPTPSPVSKESSRHLPPPTPAPDSGARGADLEFERTPFLAGEKARKERKLLLLLHISGNFEDARFT